jgi:putative hemolysin
MKELPSPTFALSPLNLPRGSLHPAQPNSAVDFLPRRAQSAIEVGWAKHQDEVREAQRLRFDIFGTEMGARLSSKVPGHDIDLFDDYCEHLLVRETVSGQVIGTYRVLTPEQAKRAGSTYSDTEFDLTRLRDMRRWSWGAAVCTSITGKVASSWLCGGPCSNSCSAITWM